MKGNLSQPKFKKLKHIPLAISALGIAILVAVVWHEMYLFNNPLAIKEHSFHLYKPTKLPKGIEIRKVELIANMEPLGGKIWHPWMFWLKPYSIEFIVSISNNPNEGIAERKESRYSFPLHPCSDYPENHCQLRTTSAHQQYQYLNGHSVAGGPMANLEEVNFIKDGTFISASIYIKNNRPVPELEWNEFIDSFIPIDPSTIPLVHASPKTASP